MAQTKTLRSKVDWRAAGNIARRVAEKAFSHLIDPIQTQLNELYIKAAAALVENLIKDVDAAVEAGLVVLGTNGHVKIASKDKSNDVHVSFTSATTFAFLNTAYSWSAPTYIDTDTYEEHVRLNNLVAPHIEKRSQLEDTIKEQIEGKTFKTVLDTWPEIAPIIHELYDIQGGSGMTVPFEQLLTRFLPALPAPATE